MPTPRPVIALFVPFLLISTVAMSQAGDAGHNTLTEAEKKDGWSLLFDGKTVNGWNSWRTKAPLKADKWVVSDGELTMHKGGGDIYTAEPYEHFDLKLEWKTTGNSGILFRVDPSGKGPIYKVAPEMQIERTKGKSSTSAGGLYALYDIACEGEKVIHPNGWNTVRIRMVKGHGTHWFNGKKVADYQIGSDDWNARVAKSKFKTWKGFGETANGHIGLQDHGARIAFRNMKIKRLKPDS